MRWKRVFISIILIVFLLVPFYSGCYQEVQTPFIHVLNVIEHIWGGEGFSCEKPFAPQFIPCTGMNCAERIGKPVIYLYPENRLDIQVQLDFKGELIADYPEFDVKTNDWQVTAFPDGHLINKADGREYSYLFWEGIPDSQPNYDLSTGFVVKGSETREFLQEKLAEIGLTPKEYNEFIVYWYPKMKDDPYNLIHFAGKEYTDTAPLTITPAPDSMLRVFMVYKPLQQPIVIQPQNFPPFERNGFTVIEWGGSEFSQ